MCGEDRGEGGDAESGGLLRAGWAAGGSAGCGFAGGAPGGGRLAARGQSGGFQQAVEADCDPQAGGSGTSPPTPPSGGHGDLAAHGDLFFEAHERSRVLRRHGVAVAAIPIHTIRDEHDRAPVEQRTCIQVEVHHLLPALVEAKSG